jgi:hypothetical protein
MGYTHYWRFHKEKLDLENLRGTFKIVSEEVKRLHDCLSDKIVICGGLGTGTPIINESEVWFNGDEEKGEDHETFCIEWKGEGGFSFCKTARKPYDLLVCASLLSFHNHFPRDVFQLSSDGGAEDWQEAVDFYNDVSGNFAIPNPFKEEE